MATTWADLGITVGDKTTGQLSVPCPRCSPFRKKQRVACLSINLDEGLWMCHHCQFSGSLRRGEDQCSTPAKVYRQPEPLPEQALPQKVYEWFQKRGIPASVVRRRKIAYQKVYMPQLEEEAGVICFPYFRGGLLVNIKYRSAQKHFRMATGCELVLYGLDDVQEDSVVFCEGELDALALEVAGITSVLSVPNGAPAVTSQNYARHFDYLASAQDILVPLMRIVLACDNDPPGQKLAEELARRLGPERCWRAVWPQDCAQTHAPWTKDDGTERTDCKDANEVLLGHGQEQLRQCIEEATPWPIAGIIRIATLNTELDTLYEVGVECGVSPGWVSLEPYYRIRPGDMTVITGVPSHGKSTWVNALMINLAREHGWRLAVYSPENYPVAEYTAMLMEQYVGLPFHRASTRMSEAQAWEAQDWLDDHFILVASEEEQPTIPWLLEKAKALVHRYGIQAFCVDPWNEVEHLRPPRQTETEYIAETLMMMRRFARLYQVHIFLVAHPVKLVKAKSGEYQGKYAPPTLYEISGSANWYNKIDVGLCIWRDVELANDIVQVHILKVRRKYIGRPGIVKLQFDRTCSRFSDIAYGMM